MDNHQIDHILSTEPVTASIFGGVYASNRLPEALPSGTKLVIANTQPDTEPGKHWVAYFFPGDDKCMFFDSYGLGPSLPSLKQFIYRNAKTYIHNKLPIQGKNTKVNGEYCIYFAVHMAKGVPFEEVLWMMDWRKGVKSGYFGMNWHKDTPSDFAIKQYIDHYYPVERTQELSKQTCVSITEMSKRYK